MIFKILSLAFALSFWFSPLFGGNSSLKKNENYLIRVHAENIKKDFKLLSTLDLDLAGVDIEKGTIDLILNEETLNSELFDRIDYKILISETQYKTSKDISKYHDPVEALAIMQQIAKDFPLIASLVKIGEAQNKSAIWALKISDNPASEEDEPSLLLNGSHHAREVMTPEVIIDMAEYLTKNYTINDKVKGWVDNNQFWLVPHVNPEGASAVFAGDYWWRKNRRGDGTKIWGVDNVRNYPFMWGQCNGSSSSQGSQTYMGDKPGSEGETQSIMNLVDKVDPVFNISFHSYSELVLYPYGCQGVLAGENAVLAQTGKELAAVIKGDKGTFSYRPGTAWQLLYSVSGDDMGWMHAMHGTISFVVELNSGSAGFQPDYDTFRDKTVANLREGWTYLINRLNSTMVTGHITDKNSGKPVLATIKPLEIKYADYEKGTKSNKTFGRFYKIMLPGTYNLEISAEGYKKEVIPVELKDKPVNLEIKLTPNEDIPTL